MVCLCCFCSVDLDHVLNMFVYQSVRLSNMLVILIIFSCHCKSGELFPKASFGKYGLKFRRSSIVQ